MSSEQLSSLETELSESCSGSSCSYTCIHITYTCAIELSTNNKYTLYNNLSTHVDSVSHIPVLLLDC